MTKHQMWSSKTIENQSKTEPKWSQNRAQNGPESCLQKKSFLDTLFSLSNWPPFPIWTDFGGPFGSLFSLHFRYFWVAFFGSIFRWPPDAIFIDLGTVLASIFDLIFKVFLKLQILSKMQPLSDDSSIFEGPRASIFSLFGDRFRNCFRDFIFLRFC